MQIERVRRYVLSSLVCSVVELHSFFLALLGASGNGKGGSRQGLFVVSVMFGLVGIGAVRLINRLPLFTVWLLGALVVPSAVYLVWFKLLDH